MAPVSSALPRRAEVPDVGGANLVVILSHEVRTSKARRES